MLKNNHPVNVQDKYGYNAIYYALFGGDRDTLRRLLLNSTLASSRAPQGFTLLHAVIQDYQEIDNKNIYEGDCIVKCLLDSGVDPNLQDSQGRTPVHLAVELSEKEGLAYLLQSEKTDISIKDNNDQTAYQKALLANQPEIINIFSSTRSNDFPSSPIPNNPVTQNTSNLQASDINHIRDLSPSLCS